MSLIFDFTEFHFIVGQDRYSVRYVAPTNPKRFQSNNFTVTLKKNGKEIWKQWNRKEFANKSNAKKIIKGHILTDNT